MFVDELTIEAYAGDGGDGVVRWLREQHRPLGGPAGGNGGNGGDVYIRGIRDLNKLSKYTGDKVFRAENGVPGSGRSKYGKNGEDRYIDLPIGSLVTSVTTGKTYTLEQEGEVHKILTGGIGGLGNEHFKSSTNRSPEQTTSGTKGEYDTFNVEVSLVADAGFVGFPNAGKSTLLNALTSATARVGDYPFTTLEPHLGELYGFVLADIPGLIEGASEGKGLGHKFLRHIGRTRMLLHCISLELSVEGGTEALLGAYTTIQNELEKFNPTLVQKQEWILLTKRDLVSSEVIGEAEDAFKKLGKPIFAVSAEQADGVKELRDALIVHLRTEEATNGRKEGA